MKCVLTIHSIRPRLKAALWKYSVAKKFYDPNIYIPLTCDREKGSRVSDTAHPAGLMEYNPGCLPSTFSRSLAQILSSLFLQRFLYCRWRLSHYEYPETTELVPRSEAREETSQASSHTIVRVLMRECRAATVISYVALQHSPCYEPLNCSE